MNLHVSSFQLFNLQMLETNHYSEKALALKCRDVLIQ